jgi:hypothetical protein
MATRGRFVTDRAGTTIWLDAEHRNHTVVELAIRDVKDGAGWKHFPSGKFLANAAWIVIGALVHNLPRWVAALGLDHRGPVVAKTIRCPTPTRDTWTLPVLQATLLARHLRADILAYPPFTLTS